MSDLLEPKPLSYVTEKKRLRELKSSQNKKRKRKDKPVVDRNFRVHPENPNYQTLSVPIDVMDATEVRRFLVKTEDLWPKPFETKVAARLIECIVMNTPLSCFIGPSTISSRQHFFLPRRTITCGLWFPNIIADQIRQMKHERMKFRFMTDTDAVAALLSMAVTRYIRPMLEFEDEIDFSQLCVDKNHQAAASLSEPTVIDTVSEQIAILNARIAILKASNNDLTKELHAAGGAAHHAEKLKAAPDEQMLSAEIRKQIDTRKKQQERRIKQIEGEYYDYLKGSMDRYTNIARTLEKPAQDSEYRISSVIRSVINECKEEAASTKNIIMNLHVMTKSK